MEIAVLAALVGSGTAYPSLAQSGGSGNSCAPPTPPNKRAEIDWGHTTDDWKPHAVTTDHLEPIYALDPNQKLALAGQGVRGFVRSGALLPYRIDFENDTNATAPAQQVFVTDRLANTLDWQTFELTEINFGDERIALPPKTQHFETNVPVTLNGVSFVVNIQAGLRLDIGQVSVTFRSLDPQTDIPPAANVGFLPPEDGTGRGQGQVAFLIRPKANLATGMEIRNVALVDFANGETIATDQVAPHDPSQGVDTNKQARVTIDAGAPTSSVAALPAQSGHAFVVQWSGQDDAGGSGIASYDVFVSTNGGPFGIWQKGTVATSAVFIGDLGKTYAFYSIAHDQVGNEEAAPATPDAQTSVITNAPLLALVPDQSASVGAGLTISNMVNGAALGSFTFSVGGHPPFGTSINATNGVLSWTPACSQGSTTNQITVWVTDSGRTNISDAISITVAVRECVAPQLGRLVLRTGDTGRLPMELISSIPLTNLNTQVSAALDRLAIVGVEPVVTQICAVALTPALSHPMGEGVYTATLGTCSNLFLVGTQQVAWLVVTAVTNQHSAFVPVQIGPSVGTEADGTLVTNYVTQAGQVVVVGEEPLLEAVRSTNGLVQVLLYAINGTTNLVQTAGDPTTQAWATWQQVMPTNLLQALPPFAATNRALFFRAIRP